MDIHSCIKTTLRKRLYHLEPLQGYIMNIEAKTSHQQFNSAKDQIKDCRNRIQAVFNGIKGMSSLWKFVGVCFIGDGGMIPLENTFVIDWGLKTLLLS